MAHGRGISSSPEIYLATGKSPLQGMLFLYLRGKAGD